jgi:hypothetical protein
VSTLTEVVEAMVDALEPLTGEIDGLQLSPYMIANATPPSIDIYPGTPFQVSVGFGDGYEVFFTVRARTTTADHVAGQQGLYRLLDKADPRWRWRQTRRSAVSCSRSAWWRSP